jgi:hypothetical protein
MPRYLDDRTDPQALLADLERASTAASTLASEDPLGVRAVEDRPGERAYLCAFGGPRFLCLTRYLEPEGDRAAAIEVISAALLAEHTDEILDQGALRGLAEAASRAIVAVPDENVADAVGEVADSVLALVDWAADPIRALASVPALDEAVGKHDAVRVAWSRFVAASEPLANDQASLSDATIDALRRLEEAAGAAGVATSITEAMADALPACRAGARAMLESHVTPLRER